MLPIPEAFPFASSFIALPTSLSDAPFFKNMRHKKTEAGFANKITLLEHAQSQMRNEKRFLHAPNYLHSVGRESLMRLLIEITIRCFISKVIWSNIFMNFVCSFSNICKKYVVLIERGIGISCTKSLDKNF